MSGICGVYSPRHPELASREIIDRMLGTIAHRGRSEHRFCDQAAGFSLAYTYLPAFLAPDQDPEPSWCESADVVVAVDGTAVPAGASEGSRELAGERHASAVARVYDSYGTDFASQLGGNFVTVLWDRLRKELFLVADRLASKHFYYYVDESRELVVFASELKAIYEHPAVRVEPDLLSLRVMLAVAYLPAPLSILKGARKLAPAEVLRIRSGTQPDLRTYWDLASPALDEGPDDEAWALRLKGQLQHSLDMITRRTPRIAVFQSGGKDSALLLAALKHGGKSELLSLCAGFRGSRNKDQVWAERAASDLGVRHCFIELEAEDVPLDFLAKIVRRFDEPGNTFGAVADHYLMNAAAEEGFTACLTGDQGEAVFDAVEDWEDFVPSIRAGVEPEREEFLGRVFKHTAFLDDDDQEKLLVRDRFPVDYDGAIEGHLRYYRERVPASAIFDLTQTALYLRTPQRLLSRHLQAGALGVECRTGFGEAGLLSFMRSVPPRFRGYAEHSSPRYLLDKAYGQMLPSIRGRTEEGGLPGFPWPRPDYEHIKRAIFTLVRRLPETGLFNARFIERLIEKNQTRENKEPTMMKLHLLFDVQCWFEQYVYKRDPFGEVI
jgi:asparagine synthetase B (glutamine-hydrolysing)